MCGLLALITNINKHTNNESFLTTKSKLVNSIVRASSLMHHRGPDDFGIWSNISINNSQSTIVFSFNRLAIVDIIHSNQPIHWGPDNMPNRYVLVFNGEIYNYLELKSELIKYYGALFKTDGDGETIAAAYHYWGTNALSRLCGMFAFVLWDSLKNEIFCARDPFGIKPLFLTIGINGTAISSEKKCLLDLAKNSCLDMGIDLSVSDRAIQHYTILQYVPEPETLNKNIYRLESGSYTKFKLGIYPKSIRYFVPKFNTVAFIRNTKKSRYTEIATALENSVAKHMRSDVIAGALLSGGIDSTAIATLAIRHNPKLLTFTAGFEYKGFSEIDLAISSAKLIGAQPIIKIISQSEFIEVLPEIVWYMDEPVADPALVPLFLIAREARKYVKVVLSGEGADELFGGYSIYREPLSLNLFRYIPNSIRTLIGKFAHSLPEGMRGKSLLQRGSLNLEARYYGNARNFSDIHLYNVLKKFQKEWKHADITAQIYSESKYYDSITRMQYIDIFTWLRGDILVKADKMTMANSLELRVPFLDPEIFAVASRLPIGQKITRSTTKYALRQALKDLLPASIFKCPKLGFPVPIKHWLRTGDLMEWAYSMIKFSQADSYINLIMVRNMLDEHRSGKGDHSRRLWTVLIFILWHSIFIEGSIKPNIKTFINKTNSN